MKKIAAIVMFLLVAPTTLLAEEIIVSRAEFCTSIADREPADAPQTLNAGLQTAYFFTEILKARDKVVSHRWFYNDNQIAEVSLKVGADRWRTWSTKQVWHLPPGTLKVQVLSPAGEVITEKEIAIE